MTKKCDKLAEIFCQDVTEATVTLYCIASGAFIYCIHLEAQIAVFA